jgi:hypothetical protein
VCHCFAEKQWDVKEEPATPSRFVSPKDLLLFATKVLASATPVFDSLFRRQVLRFLEDAFRGPALHLDAVKRLRLHE